MKKRRSGFTKALAKGLNGLEKWARGGKSPSRVKRRTKRTKKRTTRRRKR